jgi:DNA repair exonuclease SbcCD ATPase subunit
MLLSRTEREQCVIELYKQGKTIREIAQDVHMSFGDIGAIIRKLTGVNGDKEKGEQDKAHISTLSKDSQAFKLFSEGKRPIDVAIALDLKADEVNKLYRKYWELIQLHQLTLVYEKIKHCIPSFLKLHSIIKENKMDEEKDMANILKNANELPYLENKVQQLLYDVDALENKKNNSKTVLSALQNQISTTKNSLKFYQSALDEAHKKLVQLENIKNNNKDYQRIESIVERKANDILSDKKVIVLAAVISVFAALRDHPYKQQILIYDSFYPSTNNSTADILAKMVSSPTAANPEKNYLPMPFHHKEIMKIAEGLYDHLLKAAVNNTIYPLASTSAHQFR